MRYFFSISFRFILEVAKTFTFSGIYRAIQLQFNYVTSTLFKTKYVYMPLTMPKIIKRSMLSVK